MNKKVVSSHVVIFVIMSSAGACAFAESMPSVSELLDKYTQALESTASFIEHYEREGTYRGHLSSDHPWYSAYGNKKFDYTTFERGVRKFKENVGSYHQEVRWGYFSEEMKNIPADKPTSRLWIDSKTLHYFHQVNRFYSQTDNVSLSRECMSKLLPPKYSVGIAHILGYVDVDERLDIILRKADHLTLRSKTEKVGNAECFVIDADTKIGKCLVWIDPKHGYHTARVRHRAQEGQSLYSGVIPEGWIVTGYFEVLRFQKVDNIWVPAEVKAGYHKTLGSPEYYEDEESVHKRTKILLNPDHDKLGSFDDPLENPDNDPELKNGTHVKITNDPEKYTWQDGKLVPVKH